MEINGTDRAYTAGIIDGEGYVGITKPYERGMKRTRTSQLRIGVTSTHLPVLQHLRALWGGSISQRKFKDPQKHKQQWLWIVCSRLAATLLTNIHGFSIIKARQIDLALSFQKQCIDSHQGRLTAGDLLLREQYREAMKQLNRGKRSLAECLKVLTNLGG